MTLVMTLALLVVMCWSVAGSMPASDSIIILDQICGDSFGFESRAQCTFVRRGLYSARTKTAHLTRIEFRCFPDSRFVIDDNLPDVRQIVIDDGDDVDGCGVALLLCVIRVNLFNIVTGFISSDL